MATRNQDSDSDVQAIVGQLDKLSSRVEVMGGQVERVIASMVTRAEIAAADDRRVLAETFQAYVTTNAERFSRLENGPQKMLGWISLVVSVVIGGVGCLGTGVAILGTIFGIIWALAQRP